MYVQVTNDSCFVAVEMYSTALKSLLIFFAWTETLYTSVWQRWLPLSTIIGNIVHTAPDLFFRIGTV